MARKEWISQATKKKFLPTNGSCRLEGGHEGTTEDDVIHWGKSMLKADANPKRFEKK